MSSGPWLNTNHYETRKYTGKCSICKETATLLEVEGYGRMCAACLTKLVKEWKA